MAEDYTRGEMDISHHQSTFSGVMAVSVFCSILTGLVVLYLTLVFAADMNWITGLLVSLGVAGISGVVLKQGAKYWVCVGALTAITILAGGIVTALA